MNEVNYTSILIGMHLISDIDLGAAGCGLGVAPLLFAEVSPFVQAARQDAERAPLGQGWPIGACRRTNG